MFNIVVRFFIDIDDNNITRINGMQWCTKISNTTLNIPVQISFCVKNLLLLGSQLNAKFRCVQFFREVMKNENDHREQLKSNQPIFIKSIQKKVQKFAFTYDRDNNRLQNITYHYCNCIKITKNFENNYFFTRSG